ncbi:MAG: NAD-dependent epimerase/dehydratase family protein [Candidatus Dormibacter sp.]
MRKAMQRHQSSRQRYLVTGGAGFIGSHLSTALIERGHQVVGLDNLSTGSATNVAGLSSNDSYRLVLGSVLDAQLLDELVEQCDTVIHLAAAVGVTLVVEQPLRSLVTNIRGTEHVIEAAHRYRRRVFIASSSEVYGKNPDVPLHEKADSVVGTPTRSRWGYALSKAVDECLAMAYSREKGMPTVIGRFFNTVGPGQSPAYGMVIPRMIKQALAGDAVTVFGDGAQTRCFCHVSDVVRAVVGLLDHPDAVGEVFNIGSTEEVTINELAERVIATTGSSSSVVRIPYEEAYAPGFEDMLRRVPDTQKIRSLIGWSPTHDLDSILRTVVEHSAAHPPAAAGLPTASG